MISTRAGNIEEIRSSQLEHFGESGIVLIERTLASLTHAVMEMQARGPGHALRLGEINRAEVRARWSWAAWIDRWRTFLEGST
jgi:hypothetical protein